MKSSRSSTLWPEICPLGQMEYCMADVSSEEVNEFILKVHHRGLICQKFVQ